MRICGGQARVGGPPTENERFVPVFRIGSRETGTRFRPGFVLLPSQRRNLPDRRQVRVQIDAHASSARSASAAVIRPSLPMQLAADRRSGHRTCEVGAGIELHREQPPGPRLGVCANELGALWCRRCSCLVGGGGAIGLFVSGRGWMANRRWRGERAHGFGGSVGGCLPMALCEWLSVTSP